MRADGDRGDHGERDDRLSTGVSGLDSVLCGGLLDGRAYLVRGRPGTGKTLVGMHFLTAGLPDETALFVNLGESQADLERDARAFGFDVDAVEFLDLSPTADFFTENQSYDLFAADTVESGAVTEAITDAVADVEPDRVFVDPLTQLRYLSPDEYQFREHVLSFVQFLKDRNATVLFTSQDTERTSDEDLQFMSDGIVHLDHAARGRRVEVTKLRGSNFQSGSHAVRIRDDGMTVFPRLLPDEYSANFSSAQVSTGVETVDNLLSGGIERGTVTLLTGPSGVGKTTLGTQFAHEAASRGERSVVYMFEESKSTFVHRSESIGVPVSEMMERGTLAVEEVEALELSPEEFAHDVRREVETEGAQVVMLDGLEGYRSSLHGSYDDLTPRIHALCRYLANMGVTTILVSEVQNVTGDFQLTKDEVSYLADNVVFLRYLEFEGEIRKAIGVLKKRASDFERTLRGFEITADGIRVGDPLSDLRGVLTGEPEWTDPDARSRRGE